jgi:hypothetical protein
MLCRMTDRNSRSLWLQQTTSFGAWENEGTNYFFGSTTVFVKSLTKENIGSAMEAMVTVEDGMWLTVYGT